MSTSQLLANDLHRLAPKVMSPPPAGRIFLEDIGATWEEKFGELAEFTYFDIDEIRGLHHKFEDVSGLRVKDGKIDEMEFQCALILNMDNSAGASISKALFKRFNTDLNGHIDFGEFIMAMSLLSPKAPLDEKITLVFELFDNGTGRIDRHALQRIMMPSFSGTEGRNDEKKLANAIDHTMWHCASPEAKEQYLTFDDFSKFVNRNPQVLAWCSLQLVRSKFSD